MDAVALLFGLGPIVVVPVGVRLLGPGAVGPSRRARPVALATGILAAAALVLPTGAVAAALVIPWATVTTILALAAARRLVASRQPVELAHLAAAGFLTVAATFLVQDRLGTWWPPHLDPVIVRLTATHFTFAGFAMVLAGALAASNGASAATVGVALAIAGIPLTAASFVGLTPAALPGALLVAGGGLAIAVGTLRVARAPGPGRRLLRVAGASLLVSMPLAAGYAIGQASGWPWLDIRQMIAIHGTVNALGFAVPAMFGWAARLEAPA